MTGGSIWVEALGDDTEQEHYRRALAAANVTCADDDVALSCRARCTSRGGEVPHGYPDTSSPDAVCTPLRTPLC